MWKHTVWTLRLASELDLWGSALQLVSIHSHCCVVFPLISAPSLFLHPPDNGRWDHFPWGAVKYSTAAHVLQKPLCVKENVSFLTSVLPLMWSSARCFLLGTIKLWHSKAFRIFQEIEKIFLLKANLNSSFPWSQSRMEGSKSIPLESGRPKFKS